MLLRHISDVWSMSAGFITKYEIISLCEHFITNEVVSEISCSVMTALLDHTQRESHLASHSLPNLLRVFQLLAVWVGRVQTSHD